MVATSRETHGPSSASGAAYLRLLANGALDEKARQAEARMAACDLCPRDCGVDRRVSIRGAACRTGARAVVHSFAPHHGEEDCLRGWAGSGTIFFAGCNLRCVYCQNWEISRKAEGHTVSANELADIMLELQATGCHNINLVSPSHVVAPILAAVAIAARRGLRLPLAYNTGGFDSLEALALLDGVIDIYMPDMKYADPALARRYSRIRDYVRHNWAAVREMHRQVGDLVVDEGGLARRGLLVRHLVLPNGLAGTREVLTFLAEEVSPRTYVNVMRQYRPCDRAGEHPPLDRPITSAEYAEAVGVARRLGLRLDHRQPFAWPI